MSGMIANPAKEPVTRTKYSVVGSVLMALMVVKSAGEILANGQRQIRFGRIQPAGRRDGKQETRNAHRRLLYVWWWWWVTSKALRFLDFPK